MCVLILGNRLYFSSPSAFFSSACFFFHDLAVGLAETSDKTCGAFFLFFCFLVFCVCGCVPVDNDVSCSSQSPLSCPPLLLSHKQKKNTFRIPQTFVYRCFAITYQFIIIITSSITIINIIILINVSLLPSSVPPLPILHVLVIFCFESYLFLSLLL